MTFQEWMDIGSPMSEFPDDPVELTGGGYPNPDWSDPYRDEELDILSRLGRDESEDDRLRGYNEEVLDIVSVSKTLRPGDHEFLVDVEMSFLKSFWKVFERSPDYGRITFSHWRETLRSYQLDEIINYHSETL